MRLGKGRGMAASALDFPLKGAKGFERQALDSGFPPRGRLKREAADAQVERIRRMGLNRMRFIGSI